MFGNLLKHELLGPSCSATANYRLSTPPEVCFFSSGQAGRSIMVKTEQNGTKQNKTRNDRHHWYETKLLMSIWWIFDSIWCQTPRSAFLLQWWWHHTVEQDGNHSTLHFIAYREMTHSTIWYLNEDLAMNVDWYLSVYGFSWIMSTADGGGSVSLEIAQCVFLFNGNPW